MLDSRLDWVASYPKSGNTWVRLLLGAYYLGKPDAFIGNDDIGQYWFQVVSPLPATELDFAQEVQLRSAALLHMARTANGKRILVKTHHACSEVGGIPLFAESFARCAVYIVRDPRDVLPSIAAHMGKPLERSVEMMGSSNARLPSDHGRMTHFLGSWSDHVGSWTRTTRIPVHILRYEDLHADTAGELRKIVRFLDPDEDINEERIRAAVGGTQFDILRAIEERDGFSETSPKADRFFRRGIVGSHKDEVPPELIEKIEHDHGKMMRRYGYATTVEYAGAV